MKMKQKLHLYQVSVIFSMVFALVGFSYNTWRLEASEYNNNVRLACFEILKELAALEQLLYIAHYDNDMQTASPRKGWVKVGLIKDFSYLTNQNVQTSSNSLHQTWSKKWESISSDSHSIEVIVKDIDKVRSDIKQLLTSLE
ncbi:hypothetical protein [Pseudoalteromonas luteoviolacea]|uniref:Uncharacterized protein n=1 Tax=Pseudoalteromonas luteoviolacea S4054 TaxID=1129367 RepID=A0A0F6AHN7_9GAMM|nr:hypothetical protein [Pseudoalteromonas luteoviolacea]AOT11057.1 hypothetical protein S4054249_24800 [Pseudoalteromonas luteoviolacea]AOT15779.1 hypothetical protein S40542_23710 [Pseudoalteromonas luteoviolacea]AOT20878.1 hypothetical protein S4054_24720 [Pseudoalteromonas luteoviolacea]KKE85745.1 hypothetical protein N479_24635 [Pseudoalteromonas luteoviolacea S4054]KZN71104.1 hypothetical protein N481_19690 [Pseudoalteromonas luteoviolacea S4047-1]